MKNNENQMTELITFRSPKWMAEELERLAIKQLCNRGIIIRQALQQYLEYAIKKEQKLPII